MVGTIRTPALGMQGLRELHASVKRRVYLSCDFSVLDKVAHSWNGSAQGSMHLIPVLLPLGTLKETFHIAAPMEACAKHEGSSL